MILVVNNVIKNPKSSIWKSILVKRQFILGTSTDLFKMIPRRLFDEDSRLKLIDFLVFKRILIKGDWFCDKKGTPIGGYMKGSPADPLVSLSPTDFDLDMEEYKLTLNPEHNSKRILDGKLINQSWLYSDLLQERIKNDEWFAQHLEIDEKFIYVANTLVQTASNYRKVTIYC